MDREQVVPAVRAVRMGGTVLNCGRLRVVGTKRVVSIIPSQWDEVGFPIDVFAHMAVRGAGAGLQDYRNTESEG